MKFDVAHFSDTYLPEDPHQIAAREKGIELGVVDATPGSGAYLKYIASLISAQSVVEIGTGSGVGTLWLLKGVLNSGVITTIDPEVQHTQIARQALNDLDIAGVGRADSDAGENPKGGTGWGVRLFLEWIGTFK